MGETTGTVRERVEAVIEEIRPYLQADGGDIELLDVVEDKIAKVRLLGACHGCPSAMMTLTMGVERKLKEEVPEIERIEPVF